MSQLIQLKYHLRDAEECGIRQHPQKQMREMGYNLLQSVPQSMGDQWWFTVENIIEPLPEYLSPMEYDFDYWNK